MEISERNREKWEEVLHLEYTSSEDSDGENELKVPGCQRVTKFKECLDKGSEKGMNVPEKRKTIGPSSNKPRPTPHGCLKTKLVATNSKVYIK